LREALLKKKTRLSGVERNSSLSLELLSHEDALREEIYLSLSFSESSSLRGLSSRSLDCSGKGRNLGLLSLEGDS